MLRTIVSDWLIAVGGMATKETDPVPQGFFKAAMYRYRRLGGNYDHHWITQHANGRWTSKNGALPVTSYTSPAQQSDDGKELVGFWLLPGRPREDPVATAIKLRKLWNAAVGLPPGHGNPDKATSTEVFEYDRYNDEWKLRRYEGSEK